MCEQADGVTVLNQWLEVATVLRNVSPANGRGKPRSDVSELPPPPPSSCQGLRPTRPPHETIVYRIGASSQNVHFQTAQLGGRKG